MKTRILVFLSLGCFVLFATWLVQGPRSVHADQIPEKYHDTVHKGLEYLVKNQHKDGHWEEADGKNPVATTALAGIALLVEGKWQDRRGQISIGKRKYVAEIRRAVEWLIQLSAKRKDGLIYSGHPSETASYMEGHGLATLFLAGVCYRNADGLERHEKVQVMCLRALDCIFKAQSTQGGWYYTSKTEGHDLAAIMPTVIQIQALQAAGHADHSVHIKDGREYLRFALEENGASKDRAGQLEKTAAALACRLTSFEGADEHKNELNRKLLSICQANIPAGNKIVPGRDELAHYYYAQALFRLSPNGDARKKYRSATFDHLQSTQKADGSWPVGADLAAIRAAALWCIVLQLDNKSHPAMRSTDDSIDILRGPDPFVEPGLAERAEPAAYQPEAQARALS